MLWEVKAKLPKRESAVVNREWPLIGGRWRLIVGRWSFLLAALEQLAEERPSINHQQSSPSRSGLRYRQEINWQKNDQRPTINRHRPPTTIHSRLVSCTS